MDSASLVAALETLSDGAVTGVNRETEEESQREAAGMGRNKSFLLRQEPGAHWSDLQQQFGRARLFHHQTQGPGDQTCTLTV